MATKKSFVLFTDRKKEIDLLSDAQCGTLFKAILQYAETGERLESEDLVVQVLFSVFASQMDGCNEKWEKIRQARAEAGKKGGAKKGNQNAAKQNKQKQTKQAVTVTDTVTGTVTVLIRTRRRLPQRGHLLRRTKNPSCRGMRSTSIWYKRRGSEPQFQACHAESESGKPLPLAGASNFYER